MKNSKNNLDIDGGGVWRLIMKKNKEILLMYGHLCGMLIGLQMIKDFDNELDRQNNVERMNKIVAKKEILEWVLSDGD